MLSDFFIKRPIFASVTGLVILLMGLVTLPFLPVNQYPDIAPPKVTVTSLYVGANAETVESAVTNPLEQAINGVEGMRYMQSTSTNDGVSQITVTFDNGRNENTAVMDVKNRVDIASGRLPAEIKATGVTVQKNTDAIIMGVAVFSPDGSLDQTTMSNYVDRNVVDALKRVKGVGQVLMFGERKYAMRLWLDPIKMAARQISVTDVTGALAAQNVSVPAGQVGQGPLTHKQSYQLPILVQGRLANEEEFSNIVIKRTAQGSVIRLSDIGRAELGSEDYSKNLRWQGMNSVGFRVDQLPGTNALEVSNAVVKELNRLKKDFPKGMAYDIGFNPTTFISESINEVMKTLYEAIFFVILVIFLFLQSWRTTIIPAIIIPVSLVGTFFFMKIFGFSINTLTMFGLILATGIVVDDAIVVIENIARTLEEHPDKSLQEAASQGMKEVFGAVIATALVLIAVFVPVSFFPGTTGQMYQQFALTIAFSVAISTLNAVTLTPALAALILGRKHEVQGGLMGRFWAVVNGIINGFNNGYRWALTRVLKLRYVALLVFFGLLAITALLFNSLPKGFIPSEDQGYFIVAMQGPQGASVDYMDTVLTKVEAILMKDPAVNGVFAVNGLGFSGNASNSAVCFIPLKPIDQRHHKEASMFSVIERARGPLLGISEAIVIPFEPPAVRGIGSLGGFQFEVQDKRTQSDLDTLASGQNQLLGAMRGNKTLTGGFATFTTDSPLLKVTVDREQAISLDVPMDEIFRTLQVLMGSAYVNDFTYQNRSYRVYAQADAPFRDSPQALEQFYVRNRDNTMIPMGNVMDVAQTNGAPVISHFNLFRSTEINGAPAPGVSSGEAMATMQQLSQKTLPKGLGYEWSGLYLEQMQAGGQTALFLGLGLIFVFLVLAAQYESWLDPMIIILSVPLAMLGALLAIQVRGMDNNVFTQIGMVLLIGLASKNAILIVEFANQLRHKGLSIVQAALQAAVIRFRPIVMTSMAFVIGVVPLVFAEGAGAAARQALGTAVFGGMLLSTVLSLFIVPVIYITLKSWAQAIGNKGNKTA
jgi:hydrophobic/amphiphilic exporter-1 (mainly G- bacteria), HAE1 family